MTTALQKLSLLGVLDDGSNFDPRVPVNTATTITVPQGGTVVVDVAVVYNSGVPVSIATFPAWAATLQVRDNLGGNLDCPPETTATGVLMLSEAKNLLRFTLSSKDLRRMPPGRYFFDVWLKSTNGTNVSRWQLIRMSAFVLLAGFPPR